MGREVELDPGMTMNVGKVAMKRILVAYDGGAPAVRALDLAIELAKQFNLPLGVVGVVPNVSGRSAATRWEEERLRDDQLREAHQYIANRGLKAEIIEPSGDPAREIEYVAEAGDFDTIVMGSRGLGRVGRLLQGSVSEHVATHSQATVVIAR